MEDDDEFGDLYTDVLKPFSSLHHSSSSSHRPTFPLESNSRGKDEGIVNISGLPTYLPDKSLVKVSGEMFDATEIGLGLSHEDLGDSRVVDGNDDEKIDDITGVSKFICPDLIERKQVDVVIDAQFVADNVCVTEMKEDVDNKGDLITKNSYDSGTVEDNFETEGAGLESGKQGLVISRSDRKQGNYDFFMKEDGQEEVDNWDSDSEDDLQIVLNVNSKGPSAIRRQMDGSDDDDEDEDGDPLVIVADDVHSLQQTDDNEWCEDVTHPTDGDRKDTTEIGKTNGPISIVPKLGYSGHSHYPFHSQFKYIRPGATSTPATGSVAPGVGPAQVRPFVGISSMRNVTGRGRGDWRQTGTKVAPSIQKNFQPGFGFPWGNNNMAGRGGYNGGLEFTIPSHKSIFDVDIDSIEDQPWKLPGTDISDFFNFGLNEDSWREYCKQIEQSKLEATMQTKIRVYESGRTDQEFDPDLPPELAAVAGVQDSTPELSKAGRVNITQSEQVKGPLIRTRPPLPTGRSIQVETGYGERLPSVDTRPPRIRDSDAIIEIVLQGSLHDDCTTENDALEKQEVATEKEFCNSRDDVIASINYCDVVEAHVGVKGKSSRKGHVSNSNTFRMLDGDRNSSYGVEGFSRPEIGYGEKIRSPHQDEGTSRPEERLIRGRRQDISPSTSAGEHSVVKRSCDNPKESKKISGEKASSPEDKELVGVGDDNNPGKHDVNMKYDRNPPTETTNMTMVNVNRGQTVKGDTSQQPQKRQRLSSHVEQVIHEKTEDTTTCSSDNNRERTRGRKDHQKSHSDAVYRDGGRDRNAKKNGSENEPGFRRPAHDSKQELENHSHVKHEASDKRKEKESFDSRRRDQGSHYRDKTVDNKKQGHEDVLGSRHKTNHRECDRNDKGEHHGSRKPSGNGDSRPHPEKELGSRHREKDDNLKCKSDGLKSNECPKRDHSEVSVALHREGGNHHHKRERDGVLDERKRDEKNPRARGSLDDHRSSSRRKDDGLLHRGRGEKPSERDDQNRPKQVNEDNSSKKNNSEARGTVKCGWGVENACRIASYVKIKDDCSGPDKESVNEIRGGGHLKQKDRHEGGHGHRRGGDDANDDIKLHHGKSRSHSDHSRHRDHHSVKNKTCEVDQTNAVHSTGNRDDRVCEINGAVDLQVTDEHIPKGEDEGGGGKRGNSASSHEDDKEEWGRGRSKLERWMSQKETAAAAAASVSSETSNPHPSPLLDSANPVEEANQGRDEGEEMTATGAKLVEERHLETIAKLKKRSERFKLPMPGEKESPAVKNTEDEMLPPPPPPPPPPPLPPFLMEEAPSANETDMKSERPNRKRRWANN